MFARQRKTQFEDGEPFHFHSLKNTEEAMALVAAAQKEVDDALAEVSGKRTLPVWGCGVCR